MARSDDSRQRKTELARVRYAANPEKFREKARKWIAAKRAANPEANLIYQREWRSQNRARVAFLVQRGDAKRRGIPFLLTFDEWMTIWLDSGKWERRGKLAGQYVMARYGDIGPYAIGNVRICLFGDNVREAHVGKAVSPDSRNKMSAAQKLNPQPRQSTSGRFLARHVKGFQKR